MSICLVSLIGLPASGKSTLLKSLIDHFTDGALGLSYKRIEVIPVIYDDEIDWNEIQDETKWKDKRRSVYTKVESIFEKLLQENAARDNFATLIILDDNMYYRSMRYEYYRLARKFECGYCQVYLSLTKEKALEANASRINRVPDQIIERMAEKLEIPDGKKFAWEERTIEISDYAMNSVDILTNFINEALKNPIRAKETETVLKNYSQSNFHMADLAMRKIVKAEVKKSIDSQSNVSQVATELSKKRLKILSDIKSGLIELPEVNVDSTQAIQQYIDFLLPFIAD